MANKLNLMKCKSLGPVVFLVLFLSACSAQGDRVSLHTSEDGMKLIVNGQDFMVNGMNWDYYPIGTNYSYSLWNQPDDIIQEALDTEMTLLKDMGVNCLRQYTGIQPRWIQYITKSMAFTPC